MGAQLQIEPRQYEKRVPVLVFQVTGDIDGSTCQAFLQQALAAIEAGTRYMLLDLSQAAYISSAGLREIEVITQVLSQKNGINAQGGIYGSTFKSPYLKLLNPSLRTRKALQMAGFNMVLDIFDDLETALAAF